MTPQEKLVASMQRVSMIASRLKTSGDLSGVRLTDDAFDLKMDDIFVQPKQRARGENFYTPKETRVFEKKVKEAAEARMAELHLQPFYRPVAVHLEIRDLFPEKWKPWQRQIALAGLYFETRHGDLDNKEKAVLDALNRTVYFDDSSVVQCYKYRKYGYVEGFTINITPIGLTKGEMEQLVKLMK